MTAVASACWRLLVRVVTVLLLLTGTGPLLYQCTCSGSYTKWLRLMSILLCNAAYACTGGAFGQKRAKGGFLMDNTMGKLNVLL